MHRHIHMHAHMNCPKLPLFFQQHSPDRQCGEQDLWTVLQGEEETALRRCYEGVQRDGEVIRVRDTVLLRSGPRKKSLPYVAKISALWEDPETGELE